MHTYTQIQEEVAKLLQLKAKLEDDASGGGKMALKCPKVCCRYSHM